MTKLLQLLDERINDPAKSGVYRALHDRDIRAALSAGKQGIAMVELGRGKNAILAGIATALEFPDWFGGNWDALEDCLTDLSWRTGTDRVILFQGEVAGEDFGILVDVLTSAAEFWRKQGRAFVAVFIDPDKRLKLPELYDAKAG